MQCQTWAKAAYLKPGTFVETDGGIWRKGTATEKSLIREHGWRIKHQSVRGLVFYKCLPSAAFCVADSGRYFVGFHFAAIDPLTGTTVGVGSAKRNCPH